MTLLIGTTRVSPVSMRVLHVIQSMARGGAERNMSIILEPLARLGVQNVLATLWPGRSYDERVAPYVTRHDFELAPGRALPAVPGLIRLARQVDIVHTQLPKADIVGRIAAVAAGRPSVTTVHTTAYDDRNVDRMPPTLRRKTKLLRSIDAASGKTTKVFFAVSPAVRETCIRSLGVSPERIELAPYPLDSVLFDPERQPARDTLRAQFQMAPGELAIVTVGRLIPSKRLQDAIQAVATLKHEARLRLFIAGVGPEEATLRALVAELEAPVVFLGDREDIPQLLHAADVFVFPTQYEGMPLALLEAMAMAKPCVCSDIAENRNIGTDALAYFPTGQVNAFVEALRSVVRDSARRADLGQRARRAALSQADPTAAAKRFVSKLEQVLRGAPRV